MVVKTFTRNRKGLNQLVLKQFVIQIFLGEDILNLVFTQQIVKDYFYDSALQGRENLVLDKLKKHVVSNPIFHALILKVLAYDEIQDSFKRDVVAEYIVHPEDFSERDYRQS